MSNDDLGTRLSGSLHDHVDRLAGEHVGLYDVQQRVGRIRRTRRIVTVVAAAAVAAVVVPTALFVSSPSGDNVPGPVASSTPSPSSTGPVDVTLPTDPQPGEEPRIEVRGDYEQFVRIGSLFLGVNIDNQFNHSLDIDDGDGSVETRTIVEQVVVSPDGTTAAWSEPDGSVWTAWDGGALQLDQQAEGVSVVAVSGDGSCGPSEGDRCTVYFNPAAEGTPRFIASDGQTGVVAPGTIKLNDISGRLAATQTSYEGGRACSAVFDVPQAKMMWETCDYALMRFSPDGRYVTARASDADGIGAPWIAVLRAATGDPVATYRVDDGFLGAQAWEDEDHLLLPRYSFAAEGWDVVRADMLGTMSQANPRVESSEVEPPYSLEGNR